MSLESEHCIYCKQSCTGDYHEECFNDVANYQSELEPKWYDIWDEFRKSVVLVNNRYHDIYRATWIVGDIKISIETHNNIYSSYRISYILSRKIGDLPLRNYFYIESVIISKGFDEKEWLSDWLYEFLCHPYRMGYYIFHGFLDYEKRKFQAYKTEVEL